MLVYFTEMYANFWRNKWWGSGRRNNVQLQKHFLWYVPVADIPLQKITLFHITNHSCDMIRPRKGEEWIKRSPVLKICLWLQLQSVDEMLAQYFSSQRDKESVEKGTQTCPFQNVYFIWCFLSGPYEKIEFHQTIKRRKKKLN